MDGGRLPHSGQFAALCQGVRLFPPGPLIGTIVRYDDSLTHGARALALSSHALSPIAQPCRRDETR